MTASIFQDSSNQCHLDLEADVDTNTFQVQISEATTIMPTLPSLHNCYKEATDSDNDEDTDKLPSLHNRYEEAVESDNDEDTDHSDYDSDSNLSDVIVTANNETKEMCKISRLSISSSPRKSKPAK